MNNKNLLEALPVIASFYSRKTGVKVVVRGKEACTDGKTIYLPNVNLKNEELHSVMWGFLAHETAHIKYSDFSSISNIEPQLMSIVNILEDIRIEKLVFEEFPVERTNIETVINYLITHKYMKFETPKSSWAAVNNYLLFFMRTFLLGQSQLTEIANKYEQSINKIRCNSSNELNVIIDQYFDLCNTTSDIVVLAKKIKNWSDKWFKDFNTDNNENEDFDYDQELNDNFDGENYCTPKKFDKNNYPNIKRKQQSLGTKKSSKKEESEPYDIYKNISNDINKDAEGGKESLYPTSIEADNQIEGNFDSSYLNSLCNIQDSLVVQLENLMLSHDCERDDVGRKGKDLVTSSLYRIQTDDDRIYREVFNDTEGINASIHILNDISGSMARAISGASKQSDVHRWFHLANKATYAISLALSKIDGIEQEVSYFPGRDHDVMQVLCKDQDPAKFADMFSHYPRGGTPLNVALWYAGSRLAKSDKKRKIIIVLTDGMPNDSDGTNYIINILKEQNIELFAIGIEIDCV